MKLIHILIPFAGLLLYSQAKADLISLTYPEMHVSTQSARAKLYASETGYSLYSKGDNAWCGTFIMYLLQHDGYTILRGDGTDKPSGHAFQYLIDSHQYRMTDHPTKGDIVFIKDPRTGGGHVAVYMSASWGNRFFFVGGNQGMWENGKYIYEVNVQEADARCIQHIITSNRDNPIYVAGN